MTRFKTKVDLNETTRDQLVDTLNGVLADTITLQLHVKQAHWNLRGRQFIATHEFLDEVAEHLRVFADEVAERAGALGGYARGTVLMSAERTSLDDYEDSAVRAPQHIEMLSSHFGRYTSEIRDSIKVAQKLDDPATEDLLIEVLRSTEKDLWLLHSHLID